MKRVARPLQLAIHVDKTLRRLVPVTSGELTIGRGPDNGLVLEDTQVSRSHALLVARHDRWWVEDRASANGTRVNGQRVDRVAVGPGDEIRVGPFRLVLEEAAEVAAPPPTTLTGSTDAPSPELTLLLEVLETLDGSTPRADLLARVLGLLLEKLDAQRSFLFRWERQRVRRVHEHHAPGADPALPVSESLVAQVARDRQPYLVNDLVERPDAALPSLERIALANIQSILVLPLERGRRLAGVLYLDSLASHRCFGGADLALAARAAGFLAGVVDSLDRASDLEHENARLKRAAGGAGDVPLERLVAAGSPMRPVLAQLARAAACDVSVLITGETGTGKEVSARAIHQRSARAARRFVAVNCGAIPEGLVESELFGHRKGAFSGALEDRPGLIEQADGGTFFLDEVGELPPATQVKLLRVLEERQVQRIGGGDPIAVDFRLIAATHRDLTQRVKEGSFREDLLYRLAVMTLHLPPLRERPMDLPLIAAHLVAQLAPRTGARATTCAPATLAALQAFHWPGNVRQLRNALERALVVEEGDALSPGALPVEVTSAKGAPPAPVRVVPESTPAGPPPRPFHEELAEFEHAYLARLTRHVGDNIAAMARASGLTRLTIYRKLGLIGLARPDKDG